MEEVYSRLAAALHMWHSCFEDFAEQATAAIQRQSLLSYRGNTEAEQVGSRLPSQFVPPPTASSIAVLQSQIS